MKKILVSLMLNALAVGALEATTYTWVGPSTGGTWSDTNNWSNNLDYAAAGYPGYNKGYSDIADFNPGEGVEIALSRDCIIAKYIQVKSGKVTLLEGAVTRVYRDATMTVDAGASLTIDKVCVPYNANGQGSPGFVKKGAGDLTVAGIGDNADRYYTSATVQAGTLKLTAAAYVKGSITVYDGAYLEAAAGLGCDETKVVLSGTGAKARLSGSVPIQTAGIEGTGQVELAASSGYLRFRMNSEAVTPSTIAVDAAGKAFAAVENKWNRRGGSSVGYGTPPTVSFGQSVVKAEGAETAGPMEFRGWAQFNYAKPISTGGELRFMDGGHFAADADEIDASGGAFFGTGDIFLRSAILGVLPGLEPTLPLKLATGEGKALTYSGSAVLVGRDSADDTPKSIEIGSLQRAGKGSIFVVKNWTDGKSTRPTGIGVDGGPSVKVTGGVAVDSKGVPTIPVAEYNYGFCLWPVKYDSEKGFVSMTQSDMSNGLVEGEYCYIADDMVTSTSIQIAGLFAQTGRLKLNGYSTLTIGDGVNPAYVWYFNNRKVFEGTGIVDFRGSEGVFLCSRSQEPYGAVIGVPIHGSNGITFAGAANISCQETDVRLTAANEYTGGTYISGAVVYADNPQCFSSGDVYVLGGEMAGGTVQFLVAGTWANDFHVGGFGIRAEKYNSTPFGALIFGADATIDGDVELTEPTRVSTWEDAGGNCANGTILGTVSGDRLSVYSFADWKGGVLELAGDNTYTGGTEVVKQALAVRTASGFGTGDVEVYDGMLVFRNGTAVTIPNKISGTGVIRIEGEGSVNLADAAGLTVSELQIGAGRHEFTSDFAYRPLVASNERAKRARLVLKAPGTYTLSQSDLSGLFEIVLEDGATLDLDGGELEVFRFSGNPASVNGTIVETNPGGVVLMIR